MDRRRQKTRKAIFSAFASLLEHETFSHITVQQIIDKADIGRSTFYAHFETKEDLLRELCADIFSHVFSEHLQTEQTHDFSDSSFSPDEHITHILYHLRDNCGEIMRLLTGDSTELFLTYLKGYLPQAFAPMIKSANKNLPSSYLESFLVNSFADTVRWWIKDNMKASPEEVSEYFITITEKGIY